MLFFFHGVAWLSQNVLFVVLVDLNYHFRGKNGVASSHYLG